MSYFLSRLSWSLNFITFPLKKNLDILRVKPRLRNIKLGHRFMLISQFNEIRDVKRYYLPRLSHLAAPFSWVRWTISSLSFIIALCDLWYFPTTCDPLALKLLINKVQINVACKLMEWHSNFMKRSYPSKGIFLPCNN